MTKQEAKELSLEVWRYLAEHPEINRKERLPSSLYKKIEFLNKECPLCGVFYRNSFLSCPGCPLMGNAPPPEKRADAVAALPEKYRRMITIEPIIKFDLKKFSYMILCTQPDQVNIGADSGNNKLPEPSAKEIKNLIRVLERYTKVALKDNLNRIMKEAE